jgi:hypothetical protein
MTCSSESIRGPLAPTPLQLKLTVLGRTWTLPRVQAFIHEVAARHRARLSHYASLVAVYQEAKHWCRELTTKKSILQTLYLLYMRDRSEEVANEYNTLANSCSRIMFCVIFKKEWHEEDGQLRR